MLLRKFLLSELDEHEQFEPRIDPVAFVRRWPAYKRDSIWRTLRAAGIDYINADNLEAASKI